MARWALVAAGILGFFLVVDLHLLWPPAKAGAEAPPPAAGLSGKPLLVLGKDSIAYTLEKGEVRRLGGRDFIVGRVMKDPPFRITREKFSGATVWVPLDAVTELVELEPVKPGK
jgi:hypothetical protein